MKTKHTIEKFYADLQLLGLIHPVAEITKRTGANKGAVSQYVSRKDEPSSNFLDKFYESFKEDLKIVSRGTQGEGKINIPSQDLSMQAIVNLTETNKVAVNNCARLITLLEQKEVNSFAPPPHISVTLLPYLERIAGVLAKELSLDAHDLKLKLNRIVIDPLAAGIKLGST